MAPRITATPAARCTPLPITMMPSSAPRCWRAPREGWSTCCRDESVREVSVEQQRRCAPVPLVGRGWGWGWQLADAPRETTTTPLPSPPPQGGGSRPSLPHELFDFIGAHSLPGARLYAQPADS